MSTTRCDAVRLDLSARLDGETTELPADRLDTHVAGCDGCRSWLTEAERVTRLARVRAVGVPDLTGQILAAVAQERQTLRVRREGDRQVLRIAVAIAAAVQLVLALPVLLGVGVDPHASREMASFDIAMAVGFALAAWKPDRARAFVPVAFVLAGCLAATSFLDLAGGATHLAHEVGHVVALAQAGLLWALGRKSGVGTATVPGARTPASGGIG
ncbi:putative anti-sigma-YlaC factor YlaD [Hamadaea flava]|uniref:Zf-HC2 domain-containing protein n=1 Tax=Hamadaea flava TaxID=1742688 RepID=A0ABV8M2G9_9ACTN|nr:zf-HC2 domain-containing protein [Hamadaea flava]MCP2326910.1 putative anti-sigma-YlaC factor YlaD [Hamadaea flava]